MKFTNMRIIKTSTEHLVQVSNLFNKYRVFYKQPDDLVTSTKFIHDRMVNKESTIFLAIDRCAGLDVELGFTQLFPSFTSVGVAKIFILNDLYVEETYRGQGVATALIQHASAFALNEGAVRLDLKTAFDNPAQILYNSMGYTQDTKFIHFSLDLRNADALYFSNIKSVSAAEDISASGNQSNNTTETQSSTIASNKDSTTTHATGIESKEDNNLDNRHNSVNEQSNFLPNVKDSIMNQIVVHSPNGNHNENVFKFCLFNEMFSWIYNLPTWIQNQFLSSSPFKEIVENARKAQDFIENKNSVLNFKHYSRGIDNFSSNSEDYIERDSLQKVRIQNSHFEDNQIDLSMSTEEIPSSFRWQVQGFSDIPTIEFNGMVELFAV